jgi:hypothetical protein
MSLLENQTFKKQLKFIDINDENKTLSFNISLCCNHDVDKSILNEIETTINKLVLINYMPEQKFKEQLQLQKENQKLQKENEKLQQKIYEKQIKEQNRIHEKQIKEQYKQTVVPKMANLKTAGQTNQSVPTVKKGIRTLE